MERFLNKAFEDAVACAQVFPIELLIENWSENSAEMLATQAEKIVNFF